MNVNDVPRKFDMMAGLARVMDPIPVWQEWKKTGRLYNVAPPPALPPPPHKLYWQINFLYWLLPYLIFILSAIDITWQAGRRASPLYHTPQPSTCRWRISPAFSSSEACQGWCQLTKIILIYSFYFIRGKTLRSKFWPCKCHPVGKVKAVRTSRIFFLGQWWSPAAWMNFL